MTTPRRCSELPGYRATAPDALGGMAAMLTSPEGVPLAAFVPVWTRAAR